ncbi:hypothetical protein FC35_GL001083 [Limosilactobacillus coleohominis DSM 14060]|nr:hypothetical protein FC35_GL001083 [Limosilactobacillus coleohominis DSM 14060]
MAGTLISELIPIKFISIVPMNGLVVDEDEVVYSPLATALYWLETLIVLLFFCKLRVNSTFLPFTFTVTFTRLYPVREGSIEISLSLFKPPKAYSMNCNIVVFPLLEIPAMIFNPFVRFTTALFAIGPVASTLLM